jgi:formate dehydrogenase iron-sulfur subunit
MSAKAILTDTTLCTGCELCVTACKRANGLGPDRPHRWQLGIDDLSATRFTTILHRSGQSVRQQCRHCLEPACVSACLVGAMQKTPSGPVVYDADRCMGCRYCMMACPFEIPRYEWSARVPRVRKCTMCAPLLAQGKPPACVEACPEHATIFGDRQELLAEAHRRLRTTPGRYVNHVYGEGEAGGTSVLTISSVPLDFLAARAGITDQALPELTWAALSKVPPLALGMGGLMAGIFWITDRRMKLQRESAHHDQQPSSQAAPGTNDIAHIEDGQPK